jgi:hypothetical protein
MEEAAMLWLVRDNPGEPVCTDEIPFDSGDILDFFGGLISIETIVVHPYDKMWSLLLPLHPSSVSVLQLAHFSVKEYLCSPQAGYWALIAEASHLSIAQCSIAYYLHAVAADIKFPLDFHDALEQHSLIQYCCKYISDHLTYLTPHDHPALTSSFPLLLHPHSNQIANQSGSLFFKVWTPHNIPTSYKHVLALMLAACLGLLEVAAWLLTFDSVW